MVRFAKVVNGQKLLTAFAKRFILNVKYVIEYVFEDTIFNPELKPSRHITEGLEYKLDLQGTATHF